MPNLNLIASDVQLETEGRWFDDPWGMGFRFKLSRFGNKQFAERIEKLREPWVETLRDGGEIPKAKADEIVLDAFALAVLRDWNVTAGPKDKPVKYTHAAGIKFLSDPRFHETYDWLFKTANAKANYLAKIQVAGSKNSPAALAGNST